MFVNIERDKIKNNTKTIDSSLSDLSGNIRQALDIVSDIGNIWSGADYQDFAYKMEDFKIELKKLETSMNSYKDFVDNYVDISNLLDNEYQEKKISLK